MRAAVRKNESSRFAFFTYRKGGKPNTHRVTSKPNVHQAIKDITPKQRELFISFPEITLSPTPHQGQGIRIIKGEKAFFFKR
jgi:hypothetical protein